MKKLLGILVLGLLLSTNAFADELIKIPVYIHILEIDEKRYKTKTKHIDVYFRKVNKIWAQANIFWDVKKIHYVPADTRNFESNVKWLRKHPINEKNAKIDIVKRRRQIQKQILQIEKHQVEGVINVYYIPYSHSGACAYVAGFVKPVPRKEFLVMGHIMDPKLRHKNLYCKIQGKIIAHELGHMLYLKHIWKTGHLMGKYGGTKIPEETVIEARENYKNYLKNYLK